MSKDDHPPNCFYRGSESEFNLDSRLDSDAGMTKSLDESASCREIGPARLKG